MLPFSAESLPKIKPLILIQFHFLNPSSLCKPIKKIDYLELPAKDLKVVQAFLRKSNLNWTFTSYGDEYIAFNDGSIDGGFYKSNLSSTTEHGAALIVFYAIGPRGDSGKRSNQAVAPLLKKSFHFPAADGFNSLIPTVTN